MAERSFLVLKGGTGLGNRLLALATALLYARISRRRLLVDWRDGMYANIGTNAFPHMLRCRDAEAFDDERLSETGSSHGSEPSVVPEVWQGRLELTAGELVDRHVGARHRDPRTLRRISIDPAVVERPEQIAVYYAFYAEVDRMRRAFGGPWEPLRGESTDAILSRILRDDVQPVPEVAEHVAAFRGERFGEKTIGVHVRFTDKLSRLDAIRRRLERALRHEPDATIFLATDSDRVSSLFRRSYRNVVETPKWVPPSGDALHLAAGRDRLGHAREALVDLFLLASCDRLVGDESSSFAYVARLRSGLASDRIDDVRATRFLPAAWRHRLWVATRYARQGLRDALGPWQPRESQVHPHVSGERASRD